LDDDDNDDEEEVSDMLPMDDPLLASLLDNSRVQAGLSMPRVVQALQALAVNTANAQRYLSSPEVAPVLLEITRALQSETG